MRAYILEIQCFDWETYQIDTNYEELCIILREKDSRFIQMQTIDWEEINLNISSIKSIKKKSILRTYTLSDGKIKTKVVSNWALTELDDNALSLLEY